LTRGGALESNVPGNLLIGPQCRHFWRPKHYLIWRSYVCFVYYMGINPLTLTLMQLLPFPTILILVWLISSALEVIIHKVNTG